MVKGLQGFIEGKVIRHGALPTADLSLGDAALEALSRYGSGKPSHIDSITVEPNLWPTSGVIDWENVLSAHQGDPRTGETPCRGGRGVAARMNFQGRRLGSPRSGRFPVVAHGVGGR